MSLKPKLEKAAPFFVCSIEQIFELLATSEEGLKSHQAAIRQNEFGKNVIHETKVRPWLLFLRQFHNVFIYVLMAAAGISISIGEWTDFFLIIFLIVINGVLGFWQELKAHTSIAALKKMTQSRNKVMRNGELVWLDSDQLVPGDYLILHEGEVVTADIRLTGSAGLMVDESTLTGESIPVVKDHTALLPMNALPYELANMLLSGTTVVRGSGAGVVVKTGEATYLGGIAKESEEESPETPLTRALKSFAQRYIFTLIGFFFLLGIIGYFQGRNLADLSYILLASLVSAVPEGLPMVVTLMMVIGAISLSRHQVFVRYLPSVETLGSTTVIASDKTGTITTGKLEVKEYFTTDESMVRRIAILCNDAQEGVGDPLDVALLHWVENIEEIREKSPRKWAYSFDANLMLMATVNEIEGQELLLVKGAYESLKNKGASSNDWTLLDDEFHKLLSLGLRVLALGKTSNLEKDPELWEVEIVGLIGFLDPPKAGIKEAVSSAQKAGIRVMMLTGDHPMTAKAVASSVGIWSEGDFILEGHEVEVFSDEQLGEALKRASVLARILPEHKYRVVKLLQKQKEIVAVTGDGVNDVPALKAADLGIAMGNGTEAAKNVSRIVITDNNFRLIVNGIYNARIIADNIRKLIYYLISTSFLEVFLISFVVASSLPLPLAAVQILWINIVGGGVQDKVFVFVKGERNVMSRRPRDPKKQFFDTQQMVSIVTFGFFLGLSIFFLYLDLLPKYSSKMVSTIIFTSIVLAQLANGVQSQKETEPFFKNIRQSFSINPYLLPALGIGFLLQWTALYAIPSWFHVEYLPLALWKYPLSIFCTAFLFVEAKKWIQLLFSKMSSLS